MIQNEEYEIFTSSPEEREMWVAGFNYVVKSSLEMQKIVSKIKETKAQQQQQFERNQKFIEEFELDSSIS